MTDRTSADVSDAFDRARAWDRLTRDQGIDQDLNRLDRLAQTISGRPVEGDRGLRCNDLRP